MNAMVTNGMQRQKVVFKCTVSDQFQVWVSGDTSELGSWSPEGAVEMHPQSRQQGVCEWTAVIELPLGTTIEYKFLKKTDEGFRWESGFNHRHTVIPGAYSISDVFRD